jgi:phage portal protein BeeE
MSLFNKLFHTNKASPKNTLSSTMSFFFGSSMAGQNVTERTAMQNTAVYACVRVLAEGLAELPLHIYQYTSDGGKSGQLTTRFIFCFMMRQIQK